MRLETSLAFVQRYYTIYEPIATKSMTPSFIAWNIFTIKLKNNFLVKYQMVLVTRLHTTDNVWPAPRMSIVQHIVYALIEDNEEIKCWCVCVLFMVLAAHILIGYISPYFFFFVGDYAKFDQKTLSDKCYIFKKKCFRSGFVFILAC